MLKDYFIQKPCIEATLSKSYAALPTVTNSNKKFVFHHFFKFE